MFFEMFNEARPSSSTTRRSLPLAAAAVAVFGFGAGSAGAASPHGMTTSAQYAITPVYFPVGVLPRHIAGVDRRGEMAGYGQEEGDYNADCVYSIGSTAYDLSGPDGSFEPQCSFVSMNELGTAVGTFENPSGEYGQAGVVSVQGTFSQIDSPIFGLSAINGKEIAVGQVTGTDGILGIYSLPRNKVVRELVDLRTGCAMSYAFAINDHGTVFGYDTCNAGSRRYETVSNVGVFTYIAPPTGYAFPDNQQTAVFNDRQQIALTKSGSGHAFVWSPAVQQAPVDLGVLAEDPNATYTIDSLSDTTAAGMTSDGYAWVWTSATGIEDLADLVPPNSYGKFSPDAVDDRGDLGCEGDEIWLFLKHR